MKRLTESIGDANIGINTILDNDSDAHNYQSDPENPTDSQQYESSKPVLPYYQPGDAAYSGENDEYEVIEPNGDTKTSSIHSYRPLSVSTMVEHTILESSLSESVNENSDDDVDIDLNKCMIYIYYSFSMTDSEF